MSSSPLFSRRKTATTPRSPIPASPAPASASSAAIGGNSFFPALPSAPARQSDTISLPSAITSASHVATTPLLGAPSTPAAPSSSSPSSSRQQLPHPSSSSSPSAVSPPMSSAQPSQQQQQPQPPPTLLQPALGAHERMWAEMQQKLQEVEVSADHVFGSAHAKSLEELRNAQVGLAQAWMRSEEDALDAEHVEVGKRAFVDAAAGEGAGESERLKVLEKREEETESDTLLARKRRQANDDHFTRVAMSVQDVTAKLERVAEAMASVEMESRGIWAASTESDGSSISRC